MSYPSVITLEGVEQAIQGLAYRQGSALKSRLVAAIRDFYGQKGEHLHSARELPSETLIRILWDVGEDPESAMRKKRNLSSLRSLVNADLKRLYREGKNPEGIVIGPENLFTISDEAKDDLLAGFRTGSDEGGTGVVAQVRELVESLKEILAKTPDSGGDHPAMGSGLQQIKDLIDHLAGEIGFGAHGGEGKGQGGSVRTVATGAATNTGDPCSTAEAGEPSPGVGEAEGEILDALEFEEALTEPDAVVVEEIEDAADLVEEAAGAGDLTGASEEDGGIADELETADDLGGLEEVAEAEIEETAGRAEEVAEPGDLEALEGDPGEVIDAPESAEDLTDLEEVEEGDNLSDVVVRSGIGPCETFLDDSSAEGGPAELEDVDETGIEDAADPAEEEVPEPEEITEGSGDASGETFDALDLAEDVSDLEEADGSGIEDALLLEQELACQDEAEDVGGGAGSGFVESSGGGSGGSGENGGGDEGGYMQAAGGSMDESSWAEKDERKRARILAERFNGSLSEMDRFYNRYILISAGEYTVGPANGDKVARRVRMGRFHMGKFPVTNGLFDVFVEKTGYVTTAERVGYGTVYHGRFRKKVDGKTGARTILWNSSLRSRIVQGAFWYQPLGPGSTLHFKRNHPVVQVSLEDCMAFASWAGKRLPTEEEWEAACRTGKGNLYPWGNRFHGKECNFEGNGHGETTPVDLYLRYENEYGIADGLGNVLEWTTSTADPFPGQEEDAVRFLVKGGSWITDKPAPLTSRTEVRPEFHSNTLGFRCVAD